MRSGIADQQHGRRLILGVVTILVLIVVDVALIALALRAHLPVNDAAGSSAPSLVTSPTPTPAPTEPAPTSTIPPAPAESGDRSMLLHAVSRSGAWRAIQGDCETPGAIEVTSDAGQSWTPAQLEIEGPVFALAPDPDGRAGTVVVGDGECQPVALRTFTSGADWEAAPDQAVGSYITEEGTLLAGALVDPPCDAPAALVSTGGGVALCDETALARLDDGSWTSVAEGVVAIGPSTAGVAVAMTGPAECDGIAVGTISGGVPSITCSDIAADALVAVSVVGSVVWVWSNDEVRQYSI